MAAVKELTAGWGTDVVCELVGRPEAIVWGIDGDGCFQMTCQELATAALERLPIVAVIITATGAR